MSLNVSRDVSFREEERVSRFVIKIQQGSTFHGGFRDKIIQHDDLSLLLIKGISQTG
jgi:hypothetical protein